MKIDLMKYKDPLIFAAGAAVGSVATYFIVSGKIKAQAQEEIASVKETFARINQEAIEKAKEAVAKPDISVYAQALAQAENRPQYNEHENDPEPVDDEPEDEEDEPVYEEEASPGYLYEITPSEFASYTNDRTRITINRYADDVYADERYDQIDPREYLRGKLILLDDNTPLDPLDYIRRMKKDEICIRNFDLNLDIDICTQDVTYRDYMQT